MISQWISKQIALADFYASIFLFNILNDALFESVLCLQKLLCKEIKCSNVYVEDI